MKSKEQKQKDLNALTEKLNNSKSAMIIGFNKVTVAKDQEFRNQLRDAGASYQVVKNTIARLAVKNSPYTEIEDFFKDMSAIAWTDSDPVVLSKAVSKFVKDNKDSYSFKTGIVEGKVVDFTQVESIASLPSKEELIAKLLFVLNAPAQQIVSVINAVPRNLAVVIKQIGDKAPEGETAKTEAAEAPAVAEEEAVSTAETSETIEAATEETPAEAETSTEETAQTETTEPAAETAETTEAATAEETSAETESATEEAAPEATTEETAQAKTPAEEAAPEAETEEKPE
jgi:large subunit ribosomal protein L10